MHLLRAISILFIVLFCSSIYAQDLNLDKLPATHNFWDSVNTGITRSQLCDEPVLFLFSASWCASCTQLKYEIEKKMPGDFGVCSFVYVDIDQEKHIIQKFNPGLKTVPHIVILKPHDKSFEPINIKGYFEAEQLKKVILERLPK